MRREFFVLANGSDGAGEFGNSIKRHLRICRFIAVPNVHLIAFRRAQHDEV